MKKNLRERVISEARDMIETKDTIRQIALRHNTSKSTVHKDLSERLKEYDFELFSQVDEILKVHLKERHIRGGEVTKARYKKRRKE